VGDGLAGTAPEGIAVGTTEFFGGGGTTTEPATHKTWKKLMNDNYYYAEMKDKANLSDIDVCTPGINLRVVGPK
jgi:hypothetical protein